MPIRIASCFVLIATMLGAFYGAADAEKKIAARCVAGGVVQIADISIRCPGRPVWRDQ